LFLKETCMHTISELDLMSVLAICCGTIKHLNQQRTAEGLRIRYKSSMIALNASCSLLSKQCTLPFEFLSELLQARPSSSCLAPCDSGLFTDALPLSPEQQSPGSSARLRMNATAMTAHQTTAVASALYTLAAV
jgi:hypothetical protein